MLFSVAIPLGASFSYFVSLDVLKTPLIFTAVYIRKRVTRIHDVKGNITYNKHKPDRSDSGKKCARNIRIRPQKTTSFACNDLSSNSLAITFNCTKSLFILDTTTYFKLHSDRQKHVNLSSIAQQNRVLSPGSLQTSSEERSFNWCLYKNSSLLTVVMQIQYLGT